MSRNTSGHRQRLITGAFALCVLSSLAAPLPAAAAAEQAGEAERSVEAKRCITISRIRSLEVLSNREIAFEMSHDEYYLNVLPFTCPGLRRGSTIMYRTSLDQLCNVDVVTVLDSMAGGYFPGASCGLGRFEPVDKGEVAALREARRARN